MAVETGSTERERRIAWMPESLVDSLTGLGQVMFQNSSVTGLFFLLGIGVVSRMMAAGALAGALVGTMTARWLRYDAGEIREGLYGYNACLVGMGLLAFHQPTVTTVLVALGGCVAATLLTRLMRTRLPVPAYTAPFIVATWLALFVAAELHVPTVVHANASATAEPLPVARGVIEGMSEVMFQANVLSGALFLVGIFLCSWKGALWGIAGSLIGFLTGLESHASASNLALGLYGYNAALAAMALALYRRSILLPIAGAVLSVPLTEKFPLLGLATLTAPFVVATWIIIALDRCDTSFRDDSLA